MLFCKPVPFYTTTVKGLFSEESYLLYFVQIFHNVNKKCHISFIIFIFKLRKQSFFSLCKFHSPENFIRVWLVNNRVVFYISTFSIHVFHQRYELHVIANILLVRHSNAYDHSYHMIHTRTCTPL